MSIIGNTHADYETAQMPAGTYVFDHSCVRQDEIVRPPVEKGDINDRVPRLRDEETPANQ